MKRWTPRALLLLAVLAVVFLAAAKQAPAEKPVLVINMTAGPDDLHSVWMGLRLAEHAVSDGRTSIVFLNVGGAAIASKAATPKFRDRPPVSEQIKLLVEKGARVLVCPECLAFAGIEKKMLLPGVELADREKLFGGLNAKSVVFSY